MNSTTKKHLLIGALLFLLFLIVGIIFYVRSVEKVKRECNQINEEMSVRIESATRGVYKTLADVPRGKVITEDMVSYDPNTLSDDSPDVFMTEEDIGKIATVNIAAGQIIEECMLADALEKNWQETELNCIWLSTNLKQFDTVDIRVLFPDGTDYIVAAKKDIRKLKLSVNNVFFWFTEDEILNIDAAIVDANLHGARIYTTKYVKPEIEEANEVTYQPSNSVIELMNSDPNVLPEAKQRLDKAARENMDEQLRKFKTNKAKQDEKESDIGYNFNLDTTTNGSTTSKSENNHGYAPDIEDVGDGTGEAAGEVESAIGSSRNPNDNIGDGNADGGGTANE